MKPTIEICFIGKGTTLLKTPHWNWFNTMKEARKAWSELSRKEWSRLDFLQKLDEKDADFLMDLYDTRGDLVDTIFIDSATFTDLTGMEPDINRFEKYDTAYWNKVTARHLKSLSDRQFQATKNSALVSS